MPVRTENVGHEPARKRYYRAGMRLAAGLWIWASLSTTAAAQPLTFEVPPPPGPRELVLGETLAWTLASDGPAPERAHEHAFEALTFAMWSPVPRVAFSIGLPAGFRATEVSAPSGARIDRVTGGLGDLRVAAYGTPLAWESNGTKLDVALAVGIELPTGVDDASDAHGRFPQHFQLGSGSWDPFAAITGSFADDALEIDLALAYFLRTEANDVDGGDVFESAFSFRYRVVPLEHEEGASGHAVLETRFAWHEADSGVLAPLESGGPRWSVAPGFVLRMPPHAVDVSIDLPVVQPVEEHVDFVLRAGYRVTL
jgi:hypothetical protein